MSALMYGQMGMAALQSYGNYAIASVEHKMQSRLDQFRNNVAIMNANRQESAMRDNMELTRRAGVQQDLNLQTVSLSDRAAAEVAAAATGVRGNSVDAVKTSIANSGTAAIAANRAQTQQKLVASEASIGDLRINAALGQSVTSQPKPSFAAALTGAAAQLLDIYDRNQPPE